MSFWGEKTIIHQIMCSWENPSPYSLKCFIRHLEISAYLNKSYSDAMENKNFVKKWSVSFEFWHTQIPHWRHGDYSILRGSTADTTQPDPTCSLHVLFGSDDNRTTQESWEEPHHWTPLPPTHWGTTELITSSTMTFDTCRRKSTAVTPLTETPSKTSNITRAVKAALLLTEQTLTVNTLPDRLCV